SMRVFLSLILLSLGVVSCQKWQSSPHQTHVKNLVAEGLREEAQRWESSADYALRFPIAIRLPYAERRLLNPEQSYRATAYEVELALEQRISVSVKPSHNSRAPVFVDIFEKDSGKTAFKRIISKENDQDQLIYEAS